MVAVSVHLAGIHSRSKKHVSASRDYDRNRLSAVEYLEVEEQESLVLAEEQKLEGFSFVSDGQFLWQDLLRPFAESPGMKDGALTRWFETNTFYKKPVVQEDSWAGGFDAGFLEKYFFWGSSPSIAFLPGPFSFSLLSEGVSLEQAALVLRKSREFLESKGIARIVFSEPCLGSHSSVSEPFGWTEVNKAFQTAVLDSKAQTLVHVYYGPCPNGVFSIPASGVVVDLFEEQALGGFPKDKILGLGAVDATNTLLEDASEVAVRVRKASSEAGAKEIVLCPNQAFDYVPRSFASEKMKVLAAVAEELNEK